jgi:hypothetical protein
MFYKDLHGFIVTKNRPGTKQLWNLNKTVPLWIKPFPSK